MHESERPEFRNALNRAVAFANECHADQLRKQTEIPYVAHLLGVASLVLESGGSSDEAIAGVLHDTIEDCAEHYPGGVEALRARIRTEFGPAVLSIVEGCTDAEIVPKPPWRGRKEAYLAHLATASPSVRLVSCCDKLHNARAIVSDLRAIGDALFDRFKPGKAGVLWYYESLAREFEQRGPAPLAAELRRTVEDMKALAAG